MIFGRMRPHRWQLIPQGSDRPFLRAVLLMLVFASVAGAFWWHFERRMVHLQRMEVQDKAQILTDAEVRRLHTIQKMFKNTLGMDVQTRVEAGSVAVPVSAAPVLFVGIGLMNSEVLIVFPPLARRALGEGTRLEAEEHLRACLVRNKASGTSLVGECLVQSLEILWQQFSHMQ